MAVKTDINSQIILAQLHHFYNNHPADIDPLTMYYSHLKLDAVYDHLQSEGNIPDYPSEIKKLFWELAAKTTLIFNKSSVINRKSKDEQIATWAKERLKKERERYYKTYLTRKFLVNILVNEGKVLEIHDEAGNKLSLLSFTAVK